MIHGFLGTGTITEAMVEGLMGSDLAAGRVLVSPRNAGIAARLAERFDRVTVAATNQAVVDAADVVVLAVRPQIAEGVLRDITFPAHSRLISVIAATSHDRLSDWTGVDPGRIVRAIPLPFVAQRQGVTAVYPRDPEAEAFFNAMGTAVPCDNQAEFDLLAAASAIMGSYFGILDRLTGWLGANGLPDATAEAYLRPLVHSLGATASRETDRGFAALRDEYSTRGGLNEQVFREFEAAGGSAALLGAMDSVLRRIRG